MPEFFGPGAGSGGPVDVQAQAYRALLMAVEGLKVELASLRDGQGHAAAEAERALAEMLRRADGAASRAAEAVRADLGGEVRRLAEDLAAVRRAAGSLEGGFGEQKAALVELVEYDRQRRRREEADREKAERERSRALAAAKSLEAKVHHRAGRREEAVALFQEARALDPDDAETLSNLGAALLAAGRLGPAEEPLRRAVRASDSFAPARANLGHLLLARGDASEAQRLLEDAVRLDPGLAAAWNSLGNARWRLGRHGPAVEAWRRAWEADPLLEAAERNLARQQELDPPGGA